MTLADTRLDIAQKPPVYFGRGVVERVGPLVAERGRRRGGLGVKRVMEVLQDCELSAQFDRIKFAPRGHGGGHDGARARISVVHDGVEQALPGKVLAHPLVQGDLVVVETQGGGGFGPPPARDLDLIHRDLSDGKMTGEPATAAYPQLATAGRA